MANLSNYVENELLDHVLGTTAFTSPSATYVALFIGDPTDADTQTEITTGGYARQSASWDAATGGSASNSGSVSFTASAGSFGLVSHIGIYDGSVANDGNLLWHGALTTPKQIDDGDTLTFAAGAITCTLD